MSPDRWHVRGQRLPDGGPVELWIADGRISTRPLPDCQPFGPPDGFVSPGLVDLHAHVSWSEETRTPDQRRVMADERREVFARQGTLLVRDLGDADDLALGWSLGGDGRARVVGCGQMIMPFDGYPFPATRPGQLVAAVQARLDHGAPWIKIFADWTEDFGGTADTGFTGGDRISYPLDELRRATDLAHDAGARVAAHAFSRAGAQVSIAAGVDSLEHGWGLDDDLLVEMARVGTAWLPMLAIAPAMRWGAGRARDAERVAWIDERLAAMTRLLPAAVDRGIPVLAGTDWGPGIPVAHEIKALHRSGLDTRQALAAGTTAARSFLGAPGLDDGAPADLLLFAEDPRDDLDRLVWPDAILCDGRAVPPDPPPLPTPPGG